MSKPHQRSAALSKARAAAEKVFRNGSKIKPMVAYLGEIMVQQKVDHKTGRPVPGTWVIPGGKEITTTQLYALAKQRGVVLNFKQGA